MPVIKLYSIWTFYYISLLSLTFVKFIGFDAFVIEEVKDLSNIVV